MSLSAPDLQVGLCVKSSSIVVCYKNMYSSPNLLAIYIYKFTCEWGIHFDITNMDWFSLIVNDILWVFLGPNLEQNFVFFTLQSFGIIIWGDFLLSWESFMDFFRWMENNSVWNFKIFDSFSILRISTESGTSQHVEIFRNLMESFSNFVEFFGVSNMTG